ncbi:hypothetical protein RhiirA5_503689 [Rhizophagus irregularis]|uniref:Protein kinase domain-containing protein n=1 Tax=Rhizophagus irregularis TaxID=588596 RepID=A0A2N0P869_9GLOM|nr:hypothetical protein RhiirA5_503689 [Rhizophagus irregularis]
MSLEENIEENIQLINKYDIFESRFGVFKILDYDLNLDERKLKFKKYAHVLCEDCNQEIEKFSFICYNCYNKETDCNERNRMNHGICNSCFKSNTSYGCLICNIFYIFETSDYDLNLEERKAKYRNSNYILCEECNNEIFKGDFYCTYCYNEETDIIKKGHMKFGSSFKILDCNLNLEERRAEYMNYDGILCEKCNNEIDKWYYCCAYCYYKETDIIKKGHIKFGPKFGIFKTSDYNLDLKERRKKYMNYDNILCEECNYYNEETDFIKKAYMKYEYEYVKYSNEIDKWDCYCTYCYDKETDVIKKGHMKFGPKFKFGIFKTSDYNLDLKERRAEYMNYHSILCEKCNNGIDNFGYYYCAYCYDKETDVIKKNHMKFGPDFKFFNTFDYNLNLEERKAKYEKYDIVVCEKCNQGINKHNYYCTRCYNKETDVIKKGHMKFGSDFKIFNTFDNNLNLEERKAKYEKYDIVVCEKCNNEIDKQYYNCNYCYNNNQMIINRCKVCFNGNNDDCCSFYELKQFLENFSKWINENNVFIESKIEISDYDLDEDDRRVKYKNFDYILCEKCDRKYHYNYCYECFDKEIRELKDCENFYFKVYNKETKELRELKELQSILIDYKNVYFKLNSNLGIFKQIIQQFDNTKNYVDNKKILINNIRYNGVHNCWRKLRSYCCDCYDREIDIIEKKRIEFENWTSRNEVIDKLIQDNQNIGRKYGLLEWISYDKFTNINYIAKVGFAKVYSAIWKDGPIKKWSQFSNNWKRNESTKIALKVLNNSKNISGDFLNEIKFHNEVSGYMCIIKCFGITQDPITNNYALVLQYMENGDLRKYLERTANNITWDQRLNKIYDICLALNNIHVHGLIHKDLHPGNIFIDPTFAYVLQLYNENWQINIHYINVLYYI